MIEMDVPSTCQIEGIEHILYGVFGDRTDGTFVEVGAYDGITYSNTWGLAKLGWRGVYIEPIRKFYDQCVGNHKDHPNINIVNVAAGLQEEVRTFYTDGQELYTGSKELAAILGANIEYNKIFVRPLDHVLLTHDIPVYFDLLVIDVEGMEREVLAGFSVYYYMPTMVIIETHEDHNMEEMSFNTGFINTYFYGAGYSRIYHDNVNSIFVRKV